MAIPFLNNVSLTNNEIQNVRLHNTGTSNAAAGQIFFNTGVNLAQYYANAVDLWVSLKEYSFASGTYVGNTVTGTAAKPIVTVDLSAIDGVAGASERYLTKTNKWAEISTIPGTYSWEFDGDSGTPQPVASGETVTFEGGTKITTLASTGDVLKISHDLQTQTDSTSAASPAAGATFTVVDSVTRDTTGHATGLNVKTITLPAAITVGDGQINGETSGLGISGSSSATANQSGDTTFTVSLNSTAAATASTLMYRDSSGYSNVVTPASGDSTTKIATTAFVQAAVTGLLEFKGGFNASTGAIVGGGNLTSGATRVAVAVGDYYVVTVAGDFFGSALTPLTVGDSVIVQTAAVAGASVEGDFIVVQSDTDLATASTVGLGNVAPGGAIDVSYSSGTATVSVEDSTASNKGAVIVAASTGISVGYASGTATVTNTDTNTSNTTTGTIAIGAVSGAVVHTFGQNTLVQTFDAGTGATVFCDVVRGTTSPYTVTATISAAQTTAITILVQKIG